MKLQRFFIDASMLSGNSASITDKEIINQIRKVLRLRPGDRIILGDGKGKEYEMFIETMDNSAITGKIGELRENKNEPTRKIVLCQALCKKDKFEWVLQKGTEVGIAGFVPVQAARSEKLGLNRERAEKILKEAAEQSERGIIPPLSEIQELESALQKAGKAEKIILDGSGDPIRNYMPESDKEIYMYVGPEGGWTDAEIELAKKYGATIISIGPTVLRTETAGSAAGAIILYGK